MEKVEDYEPHIDEVMGLIKDDTPRPVIEEELRHNVDYYRLSIGDSKRRTVRKHGGSAESIIGDLTFLKIKDIVEENVDYNIKALVESSEIVAKGNKMTASGVMSDETGKIRFTVWEEMDIEPGKIYAFKKCRFREQYNNLSINFSSNVIPLDGGHVEKVDPMNVMMNMTIKMVDLDENSTGKTICVTVDRILEAVTRNGKPYLKLTLSDETGSKIFSDWDFHGLKVGERYVITNIRTSSTSDGMVFYNLSNKSAVTKIE